MSAGISCERAIEVEDLVLGLGAADDLPAHVESCVECKDARDMFIEERALFTARPVPAAPALALPKPSIIHRIGHHRFIPAMVAMAACLAVFVGRPHADDCDPPAPAPTVVTFSDEPSSNVSLTSSQPTLAPLGICHEPSQSVAFQEHEHAAAPAVSLASHDTNACVPSATATCDVTSSSAMP